MVELLFPVTLRQDMRDGLVTLPSLGQAAGACNENSMVRYICLPIYHNTDCRICQGIKLSPFGDKFLVKLAETRATIPSTRTFMEVF